MLPLLMGASMWWIQKMSPTTTDPMQQKVMQFMPIIFTFMFLWFPAGLTPVLAGELRHSPSSSRPSSIVSWKERPAYAARS